MWFLPTRLATRGAGGTMFQGGAAYGLPLSKYPVQYVAPTEEAPMFMRETLYPKPGYKFLSMCHPRQFVSIIWVEFVFVFLTEKLVLECLHNRHE